MRQTLQAKLKVRREGESNEGGYMQKSLPTVAQIMGKDWVNAMIQTLQNIHAQHHRKAGTSWCESIRVAL
jgi:hypothetical protein